MKKKLFFIIFFLLTTPYTYSKILEVPHKKTDSDEALMDGDLIEISDSNFGISGNKLVKRITISGSITEIIDRIEIASFEELI